MHPLVCSQKVRRLCTAAGSAGTGAWARRGAHSHSTPRAVGASEGMQFSVEAGDRQDERAKANCCGSMSHPTGGRKSRWTG